MRRMMAFGLLILLLLVPGCWDVRDVNSAAFAVSIGIDQPSDPSVTNYKVTLEFANPVPGRPMPKSLIVSAEGKSIQQAVQRIQTGISRIISFSHLRVVIVGEEIAKRRDFKDFSNYLMKIPEVALRLRLLFVDSDEAQSLLSTTKLKYEELYASEIVALGEVQKDLSLVRTNHFFNFWLDLKRSNGTAFASRAALKDRQRVFVREGGAVYEDWRLKSWLNGYEAQAANWLVDKTHPVVVANNRDKTLTYRVTKQRVKITPVFSGGNLSFLVKVKTNGMIIEEAGEEIDFSKAVNIKKAEELFARTIKQQIESAIEKSQHELGIDYLGFGKVLKRYHPGKFGALNWPEVYPTVPIRVQVDSKVRSSGLHI